jgi:hypothetical protein
MRRIIFIVLLSALAFPAFAQDRAAKKARALDDFTAYSVFFVANTNCTDLVFDVEALKVALHRTATELRWNERKRRREASEMVSRNQRKLEADPAAFCSAARDMASRYTSISLRY